MVIHTATHALLIKRADHENFWQSVTGALQWGETARNAALRELKEETGIGDRPLRSTGINRRYKIREQWRDRYPPDSYFNREHLFFCEAEQSQAVTLDPAEHTEYRWLEIENACETVFSWSNRLALQSLR